jgi:hypothetical protein
MDVESNLNRIGKVEEYIGTAIRAPPEDGIRPQRLA